MPDAGKLQLTEGDAPATPSAGSLRVYAKTDHELYVKDPNGNERGLGTSGTSYFASSAGNAGTSSYATTAGNSGSASSATTAAQSGTASYATTSGQSGTSSYSTTAGQSGTAVKASSAGESGSAGSATTAANAGSASYATTSGQAGTSSYSTTTGQAGTSVLATSAGNAGSASSATTSGQAGTSSYATTSGQAGTSAFATTASVCGTLGSNGALGTPSSGDLQNCTLATPTTKGVVYLEPKLNLLPNTQWIANSGSTVCEATSGAAPVTDGASAALVNNLLGVTGGFDDQTQVDTWTESNSVATSDDCGGAGGKTGNGCTVTGATNGYIYKSVTTVVGKLYQFSGWYKKGTAASGAIYIGPSAGDGSIWDSGTLTDADWAQKTKVFEATGTTTVVTLNTASGGAGATNFWDSVTLYEITPGYVAADTLAPDGGTKTATLDIIRTHQDITHTKGFYGMQYTKGAVTAEYHNIKTITGAELEQYKGLPVSFGMAGYSVTATDNLKIQIYDGVGTTESAFWTADTLVWKEITRTVSASATELTFRVLLDGDTSDVAYGSFHMGVNGSSIGQWNYAPAPGEDIFCQSNIALTGYTATTSAADGIINLEAASSGMIGKGVKAVLVKAYGKDSAAGDGVGFDVQSASGVEDGISVDTQVNNIRVQGQGWVKADANGDIYFDHRGSGASALTVDIKVIGVRP